MATATTSSAVLEKPASTNGSAAHPFTLLGKKATRFGFGEGLVVLGEKYDNVVVLGGDITGSVMTSYFKDKFPDRFFSMGIMEATATLVATGLALSGKVPFFASYGAFAACRNTDMLRISVCYNDANVKIGGGHAGISVGPDGATHQVLEEIAITRALPNMTLVVPCDFLETKKQPSRSANTSAPAISVLAEPIPRCSRPKILHSFSGRRKSSARAEILRSAPAAPWYGKHWLQPMNWSRKASMPASLMSPPLSRSIMNTILAAAKECGAIVTAEEHQITAGLGGAIAEYLVKEHPVPMEFVGVQDTFGGSGDPDELMALFGLTSKDIIQAVHKAIKRKK